jgi:PAS domain S-box-containing protein
MVRKESFSRVVTAVLFVAGAILFTPSEARSQQEKAPKRILVLYWYNKDFPGNAVTDQNIQSVLIAQPPGSIEYYSEYLETNRFPGEDQAKTLRDYLERKYAERPLDVIIAGADAPMEFFRKYRNELFANTPIVFTAQSPPEQELKAWPGMTGIVNHQSYQENVDLALRLHSDTEKVFIVSGSVEHDKRYEIPARQDLQDYESRVKITYLTDLSLSGLTSIMRSLPKHSIVLYVWQQGRDDDGTLLETTDFFSAVSSSATVPIYGQASWHVGKGAVGGYVRSAESTAMRAAEIAVRIANGVPPQEIPVEKSPVVPMFDSRELKRWGIGEESLPAGSIIKFRNVSFLDQYKWYAIGVISVVLLQSMLIAGLVINRSVRKRTERALRESEEQYRGIFETTGVSIWEDDFTEVRRFIDKLVAQGVTDLRSYLNERPAVVEQALELVRICNVNEQTLKLFGARTKDELISSLPKILVPESKQLFMEMIIALHQGKQYLEAETVLCTLQGERRHMFTTITFPDKPAAYDLVLITLVDITERKTAEEALMNLSGQLIQAREDECARIARELHDDVSQNMALISLGLDQLSQDPPQSEAELREIAQEILTQTKELSTEIHRISHDLHPSKLDQLGLVTALRSLCKELSGGYGLKIEFTHRDMPITLQKEISICLYRIVQEALSNVIKYSDTKEAFVDLRCTGEDLLLRVEDLGKGFDVESPHSKKGLGLLSMRERLRLVGGTVSIDSRILEGTRIDVSVPLDWNGAAGERHLQPTGVVVTTGD